MIEKYGIKIFGNDDIIKFDSKEECINFFWDEMIKFSFPYFHETVYVTIQKNEDGTETWFNENDLSAINSNLTLEEKISLIETSKK